MKRAVSQTLFALVFVLLTSSSSIAASLSASFTSLGVDSSSKSSSINSKSFDFIFNQGEPDRDFFKPFAGVADVSNGLGTLGAFNGLSPKGSNLEFTFLGTNAHWDGRHGIGEDVFGYFDASNQFQSLIGASSDAGTSASITLAADESITLGLQTPDRLLSSDSSQNPDNQVQMVAAQATKDGVVTIQHPQLFVEGLGELPPFSFNVREGDIIVWWEDLVLGNNNLYGGLNSDYDYNDLVFVIRETAVPEPGTLLMLFLSGLLFFAYQRRYRRELVAAN